MRPREALPTWDPRWTWEQPALGFRWRDGKPTETGGRKKGKSGKKGRYLVPVETHEEDKDTYPLGESPSLFLNFADLEPTESAILKFANQYGALGVPTPVELEPGEIRDGEEIHLWKGEISAMRRASTLWCQVQSNSLPPLKEWTSDQNLWRADYMAIFDGWLKGRGSPAGEEKYDDLGLITDQGDSMSAAILVLRSLVNNGLADHCTVSLQRVSILQSKSDPVRLVLFSTPKNLLGAMWSQFAEFIDQDYENRKCENCGTSFVIKPTARRQHARYCGDACRMKAYRERQNRARQLHSKGMSIPDIVDEVGASAAKVKRWVHGDDGKN